MEPGIGGGGQADGEVLGDQSRDYFPVDRNTIYLA